MEDRLCRRSVAAKLGMDTVSGPKHFLTNHTSVGSTRVHFGFKGCAERRCKIKCLESRIVCPANHVKCHNTGQAFPILTDSNLDCKTTNVVYLVSCRLCNKQYVGETKREFGERMREHKAKIKKKDTTQLIYAHFQCDENHRNRPVEDLIKVQIIEKIKTDDIKHDKNLITRRRLDRELFWIARLRTMHPFGLNNQIQGFGYKIMNLSSGQENSFNHYKIENLERRQHKKSGRHLRKKKGGFTNEQFANFNDQITQFSSNQIKDIETLIASKQLKFLVKYKASDKFTTLRNSIKMIINARIEYLQKPKPKKIRVGHNWKIPLTHKILDDAGLGAILKDKDLRNVLPGEVKKTEIEIIFTYGPTIGKKALNYNKILRATGSLTYDEILSMECDCTDSDIIDPVHGHIISGNLNLIANQEVRDLFAFGTKFRETPLLNLQKCKEEMKSNINTLVRSLAKKHKIQKGKLDRWKKKLIDMVNKKLDVLSYTKYYKPPVLSKRECKAELDRLQERYVITVVDKAANNFSFTCKKFYLMRLAQELGLQNPTPGNETYQLMQESESEICTKLAAELENFNIKPEEKDRKLALLYFNPKFHKNPIKMRFIAGNVGTITSGLDEKVAKILKMMKGHFRNLCKQTEMYTGFKHCFDIENSIELKKQFDFFKGKATEISINDFSTLYTLFEHDHLMTNMVWLVNRLSKNSGMRYIKVGFETAYWVNAKTDNCYSTDEVLEMIQFLVSNTYIKAFGKVFKQICGIIMGGKISGWLSDCSLMVDEFKFIDKNIKEGNLDLVRNFRGLSRYRDDCTAINIAQFKNIAQEIYPPSLELSQENTDLTKACVLDMDACIENLEFITKVYCKTDDFPFNVISLPFLESNICTSTCYGVFYSQVLRYQRICSRQLDFEERTKKLAQDLLGRGYQLSRLRRQFCRVIEKYRTEFDKWGYPVDVKSWAQNILR